MDHLGQLTAERARDPALQLLVRAMVRAADHVRDAEVEVVGDRRQLVGGRAVRHGAASRRRGGASRPRRASAPPSRLRTLRPRRRRASPRSLCRTGPSSHVDAEPSEVVEDRRLAALRRSASGSVSSIRSTSTPPRSSAKRRFATAVSALPRWSEPVGLGANRTRIAHASIGTCPGSAATRSSHARIAGYAAELEAALVRDVRVGVERDVGERRAASPTRYGPAAGEVLSPSRRARGTRLPSCARSPPRSARPRRRRRRGTARRRSPARACTARRTSTGAPSPGRSGRPARIASPRRSTRGSRRTRRAAARRRARASARGDRG